MAKSIFEKVPWQVQAIAFAVGAAAFIGYWGSRKIKGAVSGVMDAAGQVVRDPVGQVIAPALNDVEKKMIADAQLGFDWSVAYNPVTFAIWTEMKVKGYYTARDGHIYFPLSSTGDQ